MDLNARKIWLLLVLPVLFLVTSTSCSSHKASVAKNDVGRLPNPRPQIKSSTLKSEVGRWLGVPYRYGGNTKEGVDCSGLVVQIYLKVYKKDLYRSSAEIFNKNCKPIKMKDLNEGDLIFFNSKSSGRINHVGLYLGNNAFIHASTSKGVIISRLDESYYIQHYKACGRVIGR